MDTQTYRESTSSATDWAHTEFGHAKLGNAKRTHRIVQMATRMAQCPSGRITQMFPESAERQGAFGAIENPHIHPDSLNDASTRAAIRRTDGYRRVFVPIDRTALSFSSSPAPDLGEIGKLGTFVTKGLECHHALVVAPDGQCLGVGHQVYFRRKFRETPLTREQSRALPFDQKETRYWLKCVRSMEAAFKAERPDIERCYILDRGADFKEMLSYAFACSQQIIIRSAWNRRLHEDGFNYIDDALYSPTIAGHYSLKVPAIPGRAARTATMQIRARTCGILLEDRVHRTKEFIWLGVVETREISPVPTGVKPLKWRLLTNRPVETLVAAIKLVDDYTHRWSIEVMHRCWKTVCGVETTRLRTADNITRFATLMASVAARIEHLKNASRAEPEAPASRLFSQAELKSIKLLRFKPVDEPAGEPTSKQAVQWVAEIGGHTGPQNGLPGSETISRGMLKVETGVTVLEHIGWTHDPPWPPPEKTDQ